MQEFQRILLVDDSYTARIFLKTCFQMIGLNKSIFYECRNGKEAMEKLREMRNVDLVVSDLNMPVMDGFELVQRILASPLMTNTSIMVVSSVGDSQKAQKIKEMGVATILSKPVNPARLLLALEQISAQKDGVYER